VARERADGEVEASVEERSDLLDRLDAGDSAALGELIEHATGAKVKNVKVTLPRGRARRAAG